MLDVRLINVLSSTIFLKNAWAAGRQNRLIYATLFTVLVLTSWISHWTQNPSHVLMDKVVVAAVVAYGGCLVYKKGIRADFFYLCVVVVTFVITLFIYFYGSRDPDYGECYHAFLHAFSSLGHHAILML